MLAYKNEKNSYKLATSKLHIPMRLCGQDDQQSTEQREKNLCIFLTNEMKLNKKIYE